MTTTERAAARDVSYPLCSFLPFQTANALLVCSLGIGGIANFPPNSLKAPRKTEAVFLDFSRANLIIDIRTKIAFLCIPSCLSLWERCLSEAKTERVNAAHACKTLSVACGDSSPRGRAKGLHQE